MIRSPVLPSGLWRGGARHAVCVRTLAATALAADSAGARVGRGAASVIRPPRPVSPCRPTDLRALRCDHVMYPRTRARSTHGGGAKAGACAHTSTGPAAPRRGCIQGSLNLKGSGVRGSLVGGLCGRADWRAALCANPQAAEVEDSRGHCSTSLGADADSGEWIRGR